MNIKILIIPFILLALVGCKQTPEQLATEVKILNANLAHQAKMKVLEYENRIKMALGSGRHEARMKDKLYEAIKDIASPLIKFIMIAGGLIYLAKQGMILTLRLVETREEQITSREKQTLIAGLVFKNLDALTPNEREMIFSGKGLLLTNSPPHVEG